MEHRRTPDPHNLQKVLCELQPWFEMDTGRLEFVNRILLWRYLLGDDSFDAHYWVNEPVTSPAGPRW